MFAWRYTCLWFSQSTITGYDSPTRKDRDTVLAGLNPIAVLVEHGIEVVSKAMSTLFDYNSLMEYTEIEKYVKRHL